MAINGRTHRRRAFGALTPALCAAAVVSAGCTGSARFDLIPLRMNDLNPALPPMVRFHPSECYYRLDQQGKIHVAMRYQNLALFGPLSRVTFTLSLLLEEPPAGRARTYPLRKQNLRGWATAGPEVHRFSSSLGIAAVYDVREHSLRGRFRCYVRHQSGNPLTGWRGNALLLFLGQFHAVEDEAKTRRLETESEKGGGERAGQTTASTTQPATSQPHKSAQPTP